MLKSARFSIFFLLITSYWLLVTLPSHAQEEVNLNTANTYEVQSPDEVEDGDIIAMENESGNLVRAQTGQTNAKIFGIVVKQSPIVYRTSDTGVPIVRGGEVGVNIISAGGPIAIGDLVTISSTSGKGQKASESDAQLVGMALEAFDATEDTAKIKVALRVGSGFQKGEELQKVASLYLEELGLSALDVFSGEEGLQSTFRYGLAAIIVIFSVFSSFKFFGKQILTGIDSMGRNPLASRKIQTMIIINVALIAAINVGAIVLALFIVRF